jgi:hypothetical protein
MRTYIKIHFIGQLHHWFYDKSDSPLIATLIKNNNNNRNVKSSFPNKSGNCFLNIAKETTNYNKRTTDSP